MSMLAIAVKYAGFFLSPFCLFTGRGSLDLVCFLTRTRRVTKDGPGL